MLGTLDDKSDSFVSLAKKPSGGRAKAPSGLPKNSHLKSVKLRKFCSQNFSSNEIAQRLTGIREKHRMMLGGVRMVIYRFIPVFVVGLVITVIAVFAYGFKAFVECF